MLEQLARDRARQRLQRLSKEAAKLDSGRLPNQLSAFALIVHNDDVVLIEWVRAILDELSRDTAQREPEHVRIVREARTLVGELLAPP